MLETVGFSTAIRLQESVFDAVGLIYVSFRLHKSKPQLINAAKNVAPELTIIIVSSLDVEFEFSQTQALQAKTVTGAGGLRFPAHGFPVIQTSAHRSAHFSSFDSSFKLSQFNQVSYFNIVSGN
jgi:hypothetical protein